MKRLKDNGIDNQIALIYCLLANYIMQMETDSSILSNILLCYILTLKLTEKELVFECKTHIFQCWLTSIFSFYFMSF